MTNHLGNVVEEVAKIANSSGLKVFSPSEATSLLDVQSRIADYLTLIVRLRGIGIKGQMFSDLFHAAQISIDISDDGSLARIQSVLDQAFRLCADSDNSLATYWTY